MPTANHSTPIPVSDIRLFPGAPHPESPPKDQISVEDVLAGAIDLVKVIVIGVTEQNEFYVAASNPDIYENVYMIAKAQKALLDIK